MKMPFSLDSASNEQNTDTTFGTLGFEEEAVNMPKDKTCRGPTLQSQKEGKSMENPVMCKEGRGVRNFACQFYDACLDKAAKGMWSGFTCKECPCHFQRDEEKSN